jgi:hypothetical protein
VRAARQATSVVTRALVAAGVLVVASAGASPPGSPSGSAAASPSPPGRRLRDDPPSDDRTPPPTRQEWESAPDAGLARLADPACSAKRVREWVRVTCDRYEWNVVLLAGNKDGTDFVTPHDKDGNHDGRAWLTFAVRRGDRRAMLFNRTVKWGFWPDVLVSEQWLEGDPGPIVVVTGLR